MRTIKVMRVKTESIYPSHSIFVEYMTIIVQYNRAAVEVEIWHLFLFYKLVQWLSYLNTSPFIFLSA